MLQLWHITQINIHICFIILALYFPFNLHTILNCYNSQETRMFPWFLNDLTLKTVLLQITAKVNMFVIPYSDAILKKNQKQTLITVYQNA